MIWVHETKNEILTGKMDGFATQSGAQYYIDLMRHSRDNSPQWSAYREGNYDWHLVNFDESDDSVTFIY